MFPKRILPMVLPRRDPAKNHPFSRCGDGGAQRRPTGDGYRSEPRFAPQKKMKDFTIP